MVLFERETLCVVTEPNLKPVRCLPLAGLFALAGCNGSLPPATPQAQVRRQTAALLKNGMSEPEVTAVLGQPKLFRPGNGSRDDVAVYNVRGQNFTIYFYKNRLTRYVSSQQPVNR